MTLVLSFTWFVIGFNYYGLLHSWCKISNAHKKFENDCLSAMLGFMAEILALLVCFIVKRKRLPLTILQIFSAITYFIMTSIDLDKGNKQRIFFLCKNVLISLFSHIKRLRYHDTFRTFRLPTILGLLRWGWFATMPSWYKILNCLIYVHKSKFPRIPVKYMHT